MGREALHSPTAWEPTLDGIRTDPSRHIQITLVLKQRPSLARRRLSWARRTGWKGASSRELQFIGSFTHLFIPPSYPVFTTQIYELGYSANEVEVNFHHVSAEEAPLLGWSPILTTGRALPAPGARKS